MKKTIVYILLLMSTLFLLPTVSYAEKGDFYERHKDSFDKALLPESYIKIVKSYDFETNTFECGKLALDCQITTSQLSWSVGLANFVGDASELLMQRPELITQDEAFIKYKNYLSELSTSMLVLFLIWQFMAMSIRRYGDPEDYPDGINQKLVGVVAGAIMLGLYEPIFTYILAIQHDVTSAILRSGIDKETIVLMVFLYGASYSIVFTLFIGLIFMVFLIALLYRFVSLGFFYVVGPIAIPTIVNEEFNYFQIWLRFIVNSIVTLFLQLLCFVLALSAVTGEFTFVRNLPYGIDMAVGFILAIVFCFFALVVPSILGNLGSSTGTGRMLGRVARYAVMRR